MRLVFRYSLALFVGILFVFLANGYVRVRREGALFEQDMRRDHRVLANALIPALANVWREEGKERALQLIYVSNEHEPNITIRWVPLARQDEEGAHSHIPAERLRADLQEKGFVQYVVNTDSKGQSLVSYRLLAAGGEEGAVELTESLYEEQIYIRTTLLRMISAVAVVAVLCGVLAVALGIRLVGQPVGALVEKARRTGAGDFSQPLPVNSRDELGILASEMNLMSDQLAAAHSRIASETAARIAALEQVRHADRLATAGTVASAMMHEFGAPLNVISGRAQMIESGELAAGDAKDSAHIIAEQAEKIVQQVRGLLGFARRDARPEVGSDLGAVAQEVVSLLAPFAKRYHVTLQLRETAPALHAPINRDHLVQILSNLVCNAVQAMDMGGTVFISVLNDPDDPQGALLTVEDQGPGIAPDVLPHIFEPFFTTKGRMEGTGLGLSIVDGIAREYGGSISVESEPGRGSCFLLHLPLEGRSA